MKGERLKQSKMMMAAKWCIHNYRNNYLKVSLFCDSLRPLLYFYLRYQVLCLRYLPCFRHSANAAMPFPKLIYHILVGAHQAKLFSNKIFALNLVFELLGLRFYFDFLFNLGCYQIALLCVDIDNLTV